MYEYWGGGVRVVTHIRCFFQFVYLLKLIEISALLLCLFSYCCAYIIYLSINISNTNVVNNTLLYRFFIFRSHSPNVCHSFLSHVIVAVFLATYLLYIIDKMVKPYFGVTTHCFFPVSFYSYE